VASQQAVYVRLRSQIEELPVIDCHEHAEGPAAAAGHREPIALLIEGYLAGNLATVPLPGSPDARPDLRAFLEDGNRTTEEKWPLFARLWRGIEHTAYARVTKLIMRDVYGETEMSLPALQRIRERVIDLRDAQVYRAILDKAQIRCRLVDIWPDMKAFLTGERRVYELDRLLLSLPDFHAIRSWQNVFAITQIIGQVVTNLDDYLAACREIFRRMKERGAIGLKDQSAYTRTLAYDHPSRAEAEVVFNAFMRDPRCSVGWPEAKALDDYLFHRFMDMARDLDLPVQIHTGHMAGMWNDIAKTNAVHFIPVLELHRDVRFDLFHGNWPYMGEYLYIGKNYPNVSLDLCWLHIIDPIYARNLLIEGLTTVPHSKIHGFGGDYGDNILHAVAHLSIARDVIAEALAERVESSWIDEHEAMQIAADWLFNNPNEFFRLGFSPIAT
jgi:predicted TIM-barrel fold metal-dependent hydrolase